MSTEVKPTEPKESSSSTFKIDTFLVECMSKIGLTGTVVVFFMLTFWWNGSKDQKSAFIDQYILLKFPEGDSKYFYFIVLCGVALYFITINYYKKKLKLKDQRIEELEEDLDDLQGKLLLDAKKKEKKVAK